ncbi:MAG: lysophospholipid acyltransferase family protein [Candidatus Omnitrophica bacterium]|nr:lysophospholipid acyltransferase family protein [Candidatus Omnitrophota bacterium]
MKIKTRRYHIYYWSRVLFFLIRLIPLRFALGLASFMGKAAFDVLGEYRKIAMGNIACALDLDETRCELVARSVFVNLAKNGAEWVKLASGGRAFAEKIVTETHGLEHYEEAVSGGKGMIVLASHLGNWELLTVYLTAIGYNGTVIGKRLYFHKYDEFITGLREKTGVQLMYRDESPKKVLKVLKNGGVIGILADQDVDSVNGIFVDFFGKPAFTPVAPVRLAMASGAPIVPSFMIRKSDGTHKLIVEKPIYVSRDAKTEEDVKRYTRAWTEILEKHVREDPGQWVWIHRRWKTQNVAAGV